MISSRALFLFILITGRFPILDLSSLNSSASQGFSFRICPGVFPDPHALMYVFVPCGSFACGIFPSGWECEPKFPVTFYNQ